MEICLSCIENEKCELKKIHSSVKIKFKNRPPSINENFKNKFH